ncbi:outer membrane protein assembly factor BamC [Shewanella sp. AS1]|uniref:outer membrane protein assembly factor BamC n=1 Tax=Shewanella sp. AS1 TaxID=2907626 RepID=UPI001F454F7B|nr:outer membrane protein assembly factor BamC [Shewanella sp. AS1]MCE9678551.1 outer membrane protein assembly factor BamC [Shewanella sp. AS1]
MLKQVTPILLIAAVSACSSPLERRQANGTDEYVSLAAQPKLVIPADLNEPQYSNEYAIPELGDKADSRSVGKNLDIRPPLQILPMAEGTHVEESSDSIKIIVETIDNEVDLRQEMFTILTNYLNSKPIDIVKEDYDAGIIETDWIENEDVLDTHFFGSDDVYTVRQRYRFTVNVRPHGRSGNLEIELIDHQESYNGESQDVSLSGEDKRRFTVDILNSTIAYMSVKREQMIKAKRIRESLGIEVELVKAPEVEDEAQSESSYWLALAPYKRSWDRLRLVLPEMGFEIVDMDSNKGLYYISVNEDSGFWSSLWNDKQLPLKKGAYRLLVEEDKEDKANKTRIYLHDIADEPLENETVEEIYNGLAELMKEDRKVR